MLRVSLRQLFTKDTMPDSSFFSQDIMTMRPEQLTIPQFVELTNEIDILEKSFLLPRINKSEEYA
jgi:16S rRNA (adenine1518-N6/adenine1519-N6)-dimethyltransferase